MHYWKNGQAKGLLDFMNTPVGLMNPGHWTVLISWRVDSWGHTIKENLVRIINCSDIECFTVLCGVQSMSLHFSSFYSYQLWKYFLLVNTTSNSKMEHDHVFVHYPVFLTIVHTDGPMLILSLWRNANIVTQSYDTSELILWIL